MLILTAVLLKGGVLFDFLCSVCYNRNMYEFLKQALIGWNCQKDQRRKLQQAYLAAVLVGLILAGCLTLLNVRQGRLVAMAAASFALVFLINGAAWALLEAFIAPNLPKAESSASKTRRRK